jgi:hypothetical protein
MKTIGMSPFVIEQHVSAATSEARHVSIAAILQAQERSAIRRDQRCTSASATSSGISNLKRRIRAGFDARITHKPSSPHNKRIKFAHCVRPTRKGDAPLLAAYARRWTAKAGRE